MLIVTEGEKLPIAQAVAQAVYAVDAEPMIALMLPRERDGQEPPAAIAAAMKESSCHLTRRFSPGEQELDLEYQSVLLEAFHGIPALSHVRLTESYMLYPEKSMLYLFGADCSNPEISVEHDCSKCPNTSCFFRSTEGPAACL